MLPRPETCTPCPLNACGLGFSRPTGPSTGRLALIGEALGGEEVRSGEGFVGAAGGMLSRLLLLAQIDRADVRIDNIIACRPPNDHLVGASYEREAVDYCPRTHLAPRTLARLPAGSAVVALGGVATKRLTRAPRHRFKLDHWHATVNYVAPGQGIAGTGDYYVIPTYHPSFLQRGAHGYTPAVVYALQRAASIARGGWSETPRTLVIDPPVEWFRAWVWDVLQQIAKDRDALWLSLDTEFVGKTGTDENELAGNDTRGVTITHVNVSVDPNVGVTFPYAGEYRAVLGSLLASPIRKLAWYAPADIAPLREAGHVIGGLYEGRLWDLMLGAHALQSDFPLNLGFWAPLFSDAPAWKHLAHTGEPADFGVYRAFDAFQPLRIAYGVIPELQAAGQLRVLERHMMAVDLDALWPSREVGLQIDKDALETFREKLVTTSLGLLDRIEGQMAGAGKLTPKEGMREKPVGVWTCGQCGRATPGEASDVQTLCPGPDGETYLPHDPERWVYTHPLPPGAKPKKVAGKLKADSKRAWIASKATLVSREVEILAQVCATCGAQEIAKTHRCVRVAVAEITHAETCDLDEDCSCLVQGVYSKNRKYWHPAPHVVSRAIRVTRWFWLEPFNIDSPQQLLDAILAKGHTPGVHKKTKRATTDKLTLVSLASSTGDPMYQDALDYRAVKKVLGTYVEGTLARLVRYVLPNGVTIWRVHGEVTHRASTQRTSAVNPNLQNVVADKHGKESLAAGFRLSVRAARVGEWPAWAYGEDGALWAARWLGGAA